MTTTHTIPALTIQQPLPTQLMGLGIGELGMICRFKSTDYRGPLAIHAGRDRRGVVDDRGFVFGAVVGVVDVVDCFHSGSVPLKYQHLPWCKTARNWCWLVDHVRVFDIPVPSDGRPGIWDFDWIF